MSFDVKIGKIAKEGNRQQALGTSGEKSEVRGQRSEDRGRSWKGVGDRREKSFGTQTTKLPRPLGRSGPNLLVNPNDFSLNEAGKVGGIGILIDSLGGPWHEDVMRISYCVLRERKDGQVGKE